eukprot:344462-Rhodomonas_salina.1
MCGTGTAYGRVLSEPYTCKKKTLYAPTSFLCLVPYFCRVCCNGSMLGDVREEILYAPTHFLGGARYRDCVCCYTKALRKAVLSERCAGTERAYGATSDPCDKADLSLEQ